MKTQNLYFSNGNRYIRDISHWLSGIKVLRMIISYETYETNLQTYVWSRKKSSLEFKNLILNAIEQT